jgi:hypothetical protein
MKKIIYPLILILASPAVLADWGMMGDYGMSGYGMGVFGIIYFALAAFIFSVIFWMTHNWIVPKKKR